MQIKSLIYITAAILIFTKLLDVLSTIYRVKEYQTERNRLARKIMSFIGVKWTSFFVFGIVVVIVIFATLEVLGQNIYWQFVFCVAGVLISIVQLAVSHFNYTGKNNIIVRKILGFRFYK